MEGNRRPNDSALSNNRVAAQPNRSNNSNEAPASQPPAGIAFAIVNGNNANVQQNNEDRNNVALAGHNVGAPAASNQG